MALKSTILESFITLVICRPSVAELHTATATVTFFSSATSSKKSHTENKADKDCIGDASSELFGKSECDATTDQQSQNLSIAALPDEVLIVIFAFLDCKSLLTTVNR